MSRFPQIFYDRKTCCPILKTIFSVALFACLAISQAVAQSGEVEEVVIKAEYVPDEKLATSEVADLLDAETMSIAGDSDLGGALKRVPGLSLVGGKFIYVRGLGERYSATYFNGTLMPSPEPLQRAVPLDLFDTSVTKNVLVQKTHSANYGLEFSGGAVDIRSAAVPDEGFFKFKLSTSYNSISTSKSGLTYNGGSQDWLGVDDGGRALPAEIARNLSTYPAIFDVPSPSSGDRDLVGIEEDLARLSFTNNGWDVRNSSNPYDYGLSLAGGQRFQVNDRLNMGFIGVASLSNKWRNRSTQNTSYVPGLPGTNFGALANLDVLVPHIDEIRRNGIEKQLTSFTNPDTGLNSDIDNLGLLAIDDEERTQRSIRSNILLSAGAVFDEQHFINLTNLIARKTTDTAFSVSEMRVQPDIFSLRTTFIDWIENEIDFKQLNGEHIMDYGVFQWRYAIVDSSRDNLDSKEVSRRSQNASQSFELADTRPTRRFALLDDRTTDFGFDVELPFTSDRNFVTDLKFKFGASRTEQKRAFQGLEFNYNLSNLVPDRDDPVLDLPVGVLLDSSQCVAGTPLLTDPVTVDTPCFLATDYDGPPLSQFIGGNVIALADGSSAGPGIDDFYRGLSLIEAKYVILDLQVQETFRFNVGVRREKSRIEVRNSDGDLFVVNELLNPPLLRDTHQLSSFSMTWDFYHNMILRAAYSETLNRPILRELAAVRLFNPDDGRFYAGNSELRTAEIENFDLRYEIYFGENDYFSVSAFRKRIDNPIEIFSNETLGEIIAFTWRNSDLAINKGFEFELRKYITPYFYVASNATFIDSEVTDTGPTSERLRLSGVSERALTGVSKELYNLQFVYSGTSLEASLSYNKYSRRVDSIAESPVGGLFTLIVEEPFASLDTNFKYKIPFRDGDVSLGFKASNLLNKSIERVADNLAGLPVENYDIGRTYGISLEWKQ